MKAAVRGGPGWEPRPLVAGRFGLRSLASLTRSPGERLLISGVCVSFPVTDRDLFFKPVLTSENVMHEH